MKTTLAIAAPTFGPAVVTAFGIDIPVLALTLSMIALVLARWIAPPPLRKLTKKEEMALTLLLLIFLFLAVTGQVPLIGNDKPLGPGMAVVWGAGLGFSGLLVVELMGERVIALLRAAFGMTSKADPSILPLPVPGPLMIPAPDLDQDMLDQLKQ